MNDDAKDLIKKLLTRREASRIGNLSRGYVDVKEHPWFSSLDWDKLNEREIKAPFVPKIKNALDSSYFQDFSREESEKDTSKPLSSMEQKRFEGF